ncbi:MAG TPA: glycoside hydrolase family 3 N-terminal domain-containing protein [Actinomycetales bacterium]|nr:glycoside hydrolase family 3 N-terminal domain-containing protein [Actinomycetales bacterium]
MRALRSAAVGCLVAAACLLLAACSGGSPGTTPNTAASSSTAPPSETTSPSPTTSTPTGPDAWGPTAAELAQARADVAKLSVRQLAGQLVVARYSGRSATSAAHAVTRLHLGGVILFDDNVPSNLVSGLRSSAANVQKAMADDGRDWPAIIAVDQEGGPVARVGTPATEFTGAMALGAAADRTLPAKVGEASGDELRALGFTMVFAPDADVTIGSSDPTIGVRSPGSLPETVARVATGLLDGYREAGIVPVAKHFPGHGSVTANSHVTLPVQRASLETLQSRDFVPFQALVDDSAPAIMVTHIDVRTLDPGVPSSLSREVITGQLRDALGFKGLVVTDALDMDAVTEHDTSSEAAVKAVQAGADVLLMPADPEAAIDGLAQAVEKGTITKGRLVESAARTVALMRDVAQHPMPPASTVGSNGAVARAVATSSTTVVSGPCSGRLVGSAVRVVGGTSTDRARFTAAARKAGLRTGSGTLVRLLSTGSSRGSGEVVVALDTPYGLAQSSASTARIAAYGRTPSVFAAVMAVLTGHVSALGHLPVKVGSYAIGTGCPR